MEHRGNSKYPKGNLSKKTKTTITTTKSAFVRCPTRDLKPGLIGGREGGGGTLTTIPALVLFLFGP